MEGPRNLWVSVLFCLALVLVEGKRSGDNDDIGLLPRPTRNKQNKVSSDRKPELFEDIPDPESSAQQVSSAISGYNGGLGGQGSLLGNQGLYTGFGINSGLGQGQIGLNPLNQGQIGLNPLGQGQNGLNPYFGNNIGAGISSNFQNPYNFLGGQAQDIYNQQGGFGGLNGLGLGLGGGVYTSQTGFYNGQSNLGGLSGNGGGLYNTNPYLTQIQNPYLTNPYLQTGIGSSSGSGSGGLSTQYFNSNNNNNLNPYLFGTRNNGYFGNPYLGLGLGLGLGGTQGLFNPYGNYNQLNPYNNNPLTSRFGLGRGSLASRSNSNNNGQSSSSSQSSNDE